MLGFIGKVFSSGAVKSVESIAKEWIDTDKEKAEAQALMVKTLDPNGLMRRDISSRVLSLYSLYIVTMLSLIAFEFFGVGIEGAKVATDKLKDLFTPITTMTGAIVTASFGVNASNTIKGK